MAEMCLASKDDARELTRELQQIAKEEKMEFIDGSKETARGLKIIGYDDRGRKDGSATLHLVVQRGDGMLVTAGHMGLVGNQVALGFAEGSNRADATRFSDKVIDRLGRHWHIKVLPPGSGVLPDPTCT
jgi:hypothetical protein